MPAIATATGYDPATHRRRLARDGYSVVPEFMPLALVERLRAHIDGLLGPLPATPDGAVRDLRHPIPGDILAEVLYREPLIRLAMDELGTRDRGDLRLLEQVLIRTEPSPAPAGPTAWHIDWAGLPDEAAARPRQTYYHHVQALGDIRPGGGATMVVPGSHRLTYAAAAGATAEDLARLKADPIGVAGIDVGRAVEITARAGDLVVFDPMCLHSATRNRGATPRHVLFTSFMDRSATRLMAELRGQRYFRALPPALRAARPPDLADLLIEP